MSEHEQFRLLMERVQAGSEEAARQLVDQYGPQLIRVIRKRLSQSLRAKFDSQDFVQDVWASFFADMPIQKTFDDPAALATFLMRIARNKVIDAYRERVQGVRHNAERELSLEDLQLNENAKAQLPARLPTPSTVAMSREEWQMLLQNQPPHYRRILTLAREGKSAIEIAQELDISARTVRRVIETFLPGLIG